MKSIQMMRKQLPEVVIDEGANEARIEKKKEQQDGGEIVINKEVNACKTPIAQK